jgi:hypothetical protein
MWCNSLSLYSSICHLAKKYTVELVRSCWRRLVKRRRRRRRMTSERISSSLTLTRTDFNGMWWSLFFSSFNLCRPVCCRTCHCSSSSAKVSFSKQAIWYLIGYLFAFDLDQSSTCLHFSFSSSVESSSLSSLSARKKKKKKKSRNVSTFFQFLFILTWLFRYEYRY